MNIYSQIIKNWKSGLTVAFVSIPLSISLAVASQTNPSVGIITAIWAGLFASLFGGSSYNIIGPTGALSGILAMHAMTYGWWTLPSVAIFSGIIILCTYVLRLEKFLYFVSASTIHGFTLGVACIIIVNQINNIFSLINVPMHQNLIENVIESCLHVHEFSVSSVILFSSFLIILFMMTRYVQSIPNIIVLSPIGILIGYASSMRMIPWTFQTLQTKFHTIVPCLFNPMTLHVNIAILATSCVVAFVALLETMISARIADGITKTKHNKRKEILGLGFANLASGCMGGMPATAALARTALNIKFGATDKMSATVCSLSIALMSLCLLSYFQYMPLAVIAAFLVYIAIRMIDIDHIVRLYKFDMKSFIIMMIVAFVTLYQDPTIGILCGIALSSVILLNTLAQGQYEVMQDEQISSNQLLLDKQLALKKPSDVLLYTFKGELTFINSQAHIARFERDITRYNVIILRFEEVSFIDFDGVESLDSIIDFIRSLHKTVFITGISPLIKPMLQHSHFFTELQEQGLVFDTTLQALSLLMTKK